MKIKHLIFTVGILVLSACSANQPVDAGPEAGQPTAASEESAPPVDEPTPEPPTAETVTSPSFGADVFPILQSRCITCHGGERIEGELVMLSYAELMVGSESGAVILPGDAEGSLLYQLASTGKMPKRGANLNAVQLQTIMEWIAAGALDN